MKNFFDYRGIRIRPFHLNIYRTYLLVFWFPFVLSALGYSYLFIYPILFEMKQANKYDLLALWLPSGGLFLLLIIPLLLLVMMRRSSFYKRRILLSCLSKTNVSKAFRKQWAL